jgi:hypothetical protein
VCGLVGVINKYSSGFLKEQQEVFSTLLFLDYLRGNDSTGVFAVHDNGDVMLAKEASNPIDFMQSKEYDAIMKRVWTKGNALIGHNRKATKGSVNDENAHPFVVDDKIVLVHNGTMYGDHKKMAEVEVDSHAIAHVIHEKDSVQEALSSFDAAYALIWFDVEKGTLNFIRNSARPLWWMETANAYIWCSERGMLDFVKHRCNLTLKEQPTELPADTHQIFTLGKHGAWGSSSEKLEIKKTYTPYTGANQYACAYGDGEWWEEYQKAERGIVQDVPFEVKPTEITRLGNREPVIGPPDKHRIMTTTEFEKDMAHRMNKVITANEFSNIVKTCPMGDLVTAITFDYCYANQKDESGGYYLYSAVADDQDIIMRHFFDPKYTTEERIIQIASGDYVYQYKIGRKRWAPFNVDQQDWREAPGYCIIEAENAVLVEGGGMVNPIFKGRTLQ